MIYANLDIYISKITNFTNLLPPSINYIKTKISKYISIGYWSICIIWPWSLTKVKVTGVNRTVKMSIFCAFSRTPTRVFVWLSSKLGEMCYMNLRKNVLGSRNFEFLTQSFFSWGQTLLESTSQKWTCKQWVTWGPWLVPHLWPGAKWQITGPLTLLLKMAKLQFWPNLKFFSSPL